MSEDRPNYCEVCGAVLQWKDRGFHRFNDETGEREFFEQLICPKKKWFQLFHSQPHRGSGDYKQTFWRTVTR